MKVAVLFLMLSALSVTAFAGADRADVAVDQKYEYYDISGNTADQLRSQMNRNGTKWDDGKTYDSLTTWSFNWDYGCRCDAHGCTVDSFKTKVSIIFRYPKWVNITQGPQPLVAKWDTYMNHLITHENGHRDMAVAAGADLCAAAKALPAASSREALDREVEEMASAKMVKLNAEEKQYDATTIHGTTQGAVFP